MYVLSTYNESQIFPISKYIIIIIIENKDRNCLMKRIHSNAEYFSIFLLFRAECLKLSPVN